MRTLADLHNHSCLSPCASLGLSPSVLATRARIRGLGLVALTDHNSARNCPAFERACAREGIVPLFGLEACSIEEVHVLCLFGTVAEALVFGGFIEDHLQDLPYDPDILGDQAVVDEDENVLELPERYLGAASTLDFDAICREADERGAIVIPAHVDRPMFSISSQLGFLPPGPYSAVESMREPPGCLRGGFPVVSGSDAHVPEHVGRRPFAIDGGTVPVPGMPGGMVAELLRSALREGRALPYWSA